jgi:hypothetical protein
VVPRAYVFSLDAAMKREYVRWLRRNKHVTWEVNVLARVEQREPDLPFWWYKADHDSSIFTNYLSPEFADGRRGPRMASGNARHHRLV